MVHTLDEAMTNAHRLLTMLLLTYLLVLLGGNITIIYAIVLLLFLQWLLTAYILVRAVFDKPDIDGMEDVWNQ